MSTWQSTSVALYFDRVQLPSIPLASFESARDLFTEHDLSPILFSADGDDFDDYDGYALQGDAERQTLHWGVEFPRRGDQLLDALRRGAVSDLDLDTPRPGARDRDDSRLMVSVSGTYGMLYVGIDDELVLSPAVLLRRAYRMARGLPAIRYGIAYNMPVDQHPASYAAGHRATSTSEVINMIRERRDWNQRPKTPEDLWTEELIQRKRHLTGHFRNAYRANLLSDAHLRKAPWLKTCAVGVLTELGESVWLWELSEQEIPIACKMLQERRLLVEHRDNDHKE